MRDGWCVKPLRDVCTLQRGFDLPTQDRRPGTNLLVSSSGFIDTHDEGRVQGPGVVTGRSGSIGNVFYVEDDFWPLNTTLYVRDFHNNDPRFVFYLLTSFDLGRYAGGTGVPTLNRNDVHGVAVQVPTSVDEQRRIVAILDEAFDGIATAKANTQKNLSNARELFDAKVDEVIQQCTQWPAKQLGDTCDIARGGSPRPIKAFLTDAPDGVNWVKIGDASASSKYIYETAERIKPSGVSRSRMVHNGDFLLSNSMSFGRPYIMRTSGCIHDGWLVLSGYQQEFDQDFLYLLLGSRYVYRQFDRLAAGSTVRNLNIDLASRTVVPVPPLDEQLRFAKALESLSQGVVELASVHERKLAALDELKKSLLHQAFTGQLTSAKPTSVAVHAAIESNTPEFTANVIAIAFARHERERREQTFGHVKAQKLLHLTESIAKIDLGRHPIKDAAGPNDFQHMLAAEKWAKTNKFFDMARRGEGYEFRKLSEYDKHLSNARKAMNPFLPQLEPIIDLVVPMDTKEAEVLATVHAAWNNLLIDGSEVTDDAIVWAAREDWHADKLEIPESKFRTAIDLIRRKGLAPDGSGKYVGGQRRLL